MSTRSRIFVEIKDSDKHKSFKFNAEKLVSGCKYNADYPNSEGVVTIEDENYISIYHHWDGYPQGLGEALLKYFNDYDSAFNLTLLGDCSSVLDGIVESYRASRGEKWFDVAPQLIVELENYECWWEEYAYLFTNGKWCVAPFTIIDGRTTLKYDDFRLLEEVLEELNREKK